MQPEHNPNRGRTILVWAMLTLLLVSCLAISAAHRQAGVTYVAAPVAATAAPATCQASAATVRNVEVMW
jgi:hypothetical protein